MIRPTVLLIAGAVLLCCSCSDNSTSSDDGDDLGLKAADYFPTILYSSWEYSVYDSLGNPARDEAGQPVTVTFGIPEKVAEQGDTAFYRMGFPSFATGPVEIWPHVFSDIHPWTVASETDSIRIAFDDMVTHVYSADVEFTPEVAFDGPFFSIDSSVAVFTHAMPFESYSDYFMAIACSLTVNDPLPEHDVIAYVGKEVRTTAPVFECDTTFWVVCATDDKVYQFYKRGTDFDLVTPDSCYILLSAPLQVGRRWDDAKYKYKILSIGPMSMGDTTLSNVIEVGQYWGSVGSDSVYVKWYARNIGIIKSTDGNTRFELQAYTP
ncbi:MAG: hypothetical protein OEW00_11790 [candidate division Zixibacteria bacterium]|nr:hypothetical protein [candidate division Zixibacteria bacterium]